MRAAPFIRRVSATVTVGAVWLVLVACGQALEPVSTVAPDTTVDTSAPEPVAALPDGDYLAFVIVGEDETDETTLGVDVAEMLTGEEAREAAVEDGIIGEGEDLPNDFYIDNPEAEFELMRAAPDASIELISSTDTARTVELDLTDLTAVYNGTYGGEPIYGILANKGIFMEVTVEEGEITRLEQVYLP